MVEASATGSSWKRDAKGLAIAFLACFATAGAGALFTNQGLIEWYPGLRKPSWNPPNQVFGPVWTFLYASMAVAAWRVWRKGSNLGGLRLFAAQLLLNFAWSALFFGLRLPGAALVEIVLLWCAIAATILSFRKVDGLAALLLVPYLAWVTFAAALNGAIWRLNR